MATSLPPQTSPLPRSKLAVTNGFMLHVGLGAAPHGSLWESGAPLAPTIHSRFRPLGNACNALLRTLSTAEARLLELGYEQIEGLLQH